MSSIYIQSMHPKTEISPTPAAIEKILKARWVGQIKIHGHRAQVHLNANSDEVIVYNRQGRPHKQLLAPAMILELRRLFDLTTGWTVIDAEWLKPENKLYLFDLLKKDDQNLRSLTYLERHQILPKLYISPLIQTLPLLFTVEKCLEVLTNPDENIEGLVFKSASSKGFSDTSIVRCRKRL